MWEEHDEKARQRKRVATVCGPAIEDLNVMALLAPQRRPLQGSVYLPVLPLPLGYDSGARVRAVLMEAGGLRKARRAC